MSSGARETAWLMGANTRVGTPMHSPQYQGTKPGYNTRVRYIDIYRDSGYNTRVKSPMHSPIKVSEVTAQIQSVLSCIELELCRTALNYNALCTSLKYVICITVQCSAVHLELQSNAVQCPAGISCITQRNILPCWVGG